MNSKIACIAFALALATPLHAEHTPQIGWDGHLFPSFLISNAAVKLDNDAEDETVLGDLTGEVGIEIVSPGMANLSTESKAL